jgi:hypothetical protein
MEVEDMTSIKRDVAPGRRAKLNRNSVARRMSPAIDAQRRLNERRRDPGEISTSHVRPRDPVYEYLRQSHD